MTPDSIPYPLVALVVTALVGAVGILFRELLKSERQRCAEAAALATRWEQKFDRLLEATERGTAVAETLATNSHAPRVPRRQAPR